MHQSIPWSESFVGEDEFTLRSTKLRRHVYTLLESNDKIDQKLGLEICPGGGVEGARSAVMPTNQEVG